MDRSIFYSELRKRDSNLFGTSLSQSQVSGLESILDAGADQHVTHLAYDLATAYHETGRKMIPSVENLNYSVDGLLGTFSRARISRADAERLGRKGSRPADQRAIANILYGGDWGRENLGNIQLNDGWDFRGRGQAQVTGRTNYERVRAATGVDVVANPDLMLDPHVSAIALVVGSREGWFTGKKHSDYLPGDYFGARRIINGTDKAATIAGYAKSFEKALRAAGFSEPISRPMIQIGATGPAVGELQTLLDFRGYPLVVDGDFGPRTRQALIKYQTSRGLTADGICGPKTWAALTGV